MTFPDFSRKGSHPVKFPINPLRGPKSQSEKSLNVSAGSSAMTRNSATKNGSNQGMQNNAAYKSDASLSSTINNHEISSSTGSIIINCTNLEDNKRFSISDEQLTTPQLSNMRYVMASEAGSPSLDADSLTTDADDDDDDDIYLQNCDVPTPTNYFPPPPHNASEAYHGHKHKRTKHRERPIDILNLTAPELPSNFGDISESPNTPRRLNKSFQNGYDDYHRNNEVSNFFKLTKDDNYVDTRVAKPLNRQAKAQGRKLSVATTASSQHSIETDV